VRQLSFPTHVGASSLRRGAQRVLKHKFNLNKLKIQFLPQNALFFHHKDKLMNACWETFYLDHHTKHTVCPTGTFAGGNIGVKLRVR
jgi:hypothetical protein